MFNVSFRTMKKLIFVIFAFITLSIHSVSAFEISDIKNYSAIVVKTMVESDTLHKETSKKTEIRNGEALRTILGDEKIKFDTEYVYIGDKKIEENGSTTWYHYKSPKAKKPVYHLYYQKKEPMYYAQTGDTLAVIRTSDTELVLLITQKGSKAEQELFDIIGFQSTNKDKSWWKKLWEQKSDTDQEEYDLKSDNLPVDAIKPKTWARVYFTPGPECENNIIAEINQAKKIDIAVYSITNQNIVDALVAAKDRGAKIRIITDRLQSAGKYSLVPYLEEQGFDIVTNKKHKIMHNKFAIFDGKRIENGSYNWTKNASESNAENCSFFEQQDKIYTNQFEYLWDLYQE